MVYVYTYMIKMCTAITEGSLGTVHYRKYTVHTCVFIQDKDVHGDYGGVPRHRSPRDGARGILPGIHASTAAIPTRGQSGYGLLL
jgi:hypothetical protein